MRISDQNLADLDTMIGRFFKIEDITYGGHKQPFIVRYRGFLLSKNSSEGFDQIFEALKPYKLIPFLNNDEDLQSLALVPEPEGNRLPNPRLNLFLFILTIISVLFTGGLYNTAEELPAHFLQAASTLIMNGWPFAVSLLTILGAHEFGHYFAGRHHGVKVTLPFFIPFPLSMFGTMGAFINMRSVPKNRQALFDLAVAGPLSGLFISIIVLIIGLSMSSLSQIPLTIPSQTGFQMEGNSLLYLFLKYATFGRLLPEPLNINGISLFLYWIRYFFTGLPFPFGAMDVMLNPVAWAGWAGLLVTGINLIPAGQLDGGHIFHTVFGKKVSTQIFPFIVAILMIMGFFWNGWWVWTVLILLFGRKHAEPLNQVTKLDKTRKYIGFFALVVFILVFVPVPIMFFGV